jgi:NgoFVII restriction endonuclease
MGVSKDVSSKGLFCARVTLTLTILLVMQSIPKIVTLPLVSTRGGVISVPRASGLNWGQRPGREQNQAYLQVPAYIQRYNFFPNIGEPFLIECDDGEVLKCVRAQANGKAIQTTSNNSLMGLYFRKRLNVLPGYTITIDHLNRYGRSSVDITRLNPFKFALDFSPFA